jgi:hypothetical protein
MKKYTPLLLIFIFNQLFIAAQNVTFSDGTTVQVNDASFNYEDIRRASIGMVLNLDGLAGSKIGTASYLQPEKFHLATSIGFSSINLETTIFFTGRTKEREKGFAIKYRATGYRTLNQYVLQQAVNKRKELGVYLAINDYGHILKESMENDVDAFPFTKQTTFYFGVAAVNYWHCNINVDNNFMRRGQYIGRTIFAPFITFGSEVDTVSKNFTIDEVPSYGARLMYELSNTFGLLGGKIRGRTNIIVRLGIDLATNKNKDFTTEAIFAFGMVYNFAGTRLK